MAKIVKVILDNGEEKEIKDLKPLSYFEKENPDANKFYHKRRYERQFLSFEDEIIGLLDDDNLKDFAENHFDLVNENDVEEKELSDFTDSEILEEIRDRKIFGNSTSIITEDFLLRFSKIIEKENALLLENLLVDFESKLNIV